jgi:DNA-binding CsgD family transcriptional regulator
VNLHELHVDLAHDGEGLRHELFARIAEVTQYAAELRSLAPFFDFAFWNTFDLFDTNAATLWRHSVGGEWEITAAAGEHIPIPESFDSWAQLNDLAMRKRRVIATPESGADANHSILWSSPCLIRGRSLVLHLYCVETASHADIILEFIGAITPLFGNFDEVDPVMHMTKATSNALGNRKGPLTFTSRQSAILKSLNDDLTYAQIAQRMGFSESTIKQEAMKIFRLLNVSNRSEAVLACRSHNSAMETLSRGV